jgi:hypothetical protein
MPVKTRSQTSKELSHPVKELTHPVKELSHPVINRTLLYASYEPQSTYTYDNPLKATAKAPTSYRPPIPDVSDVLYQTVGDLFIPKLDSFLFFKKRVAFMLTSIYELDRRLMHIAGQVAFSESVGQTTEMILYEAEKRKVRFIKLRAVAELFFFITLYYPETHSSIAHGSNMRLLTCMIEKINELKHSINDTCNQPVTCSETQTIQTLEIALDMCEKTLNSLNV